MTYLSWLLVSIVCAMSSGCRPDAEPFNVGELEQEGFIDMLFVGNSLTYTNNLPDVVAAMSRIMNESDVVRAASVVFPNYNLEDHWSEGAAQHAVGRSGWEYVVLQQGPSSVEANREQLIASTQQFSKLIHAAGAKPALFAAWPQASRLVDFERAIESYELAASAVNGKLFPVSAAWHIALTRDPDLRLYSDGLHPSITGTYLTAAVIYGVLYNKSVTNLPDTISLGTVRLSVSGDVGKLLREAADSANAKFRP